MASTILSGCWSRAPCNVGVALLLDSTHKRWFLVTVVLTVVAVAVYVFFNRRTPVTGGSTVGLWYGAASAALMVYAGLLSYHRRRMRSNRLGNRKTWLRGHIWLGLLSGPLAVLHSGCSWGGPLERALWGVLIAVLVSGVIGFVLQNVLPRLLTMRVPCEAPYEQIPHMVQVMRQKADGLTDAICGALEEDEQDIESTRGAAKLAQNGPSQLRQFYERDIRPFFVSKPPRRSPMINAMQTQARLAKVRMLDGLEDKQEQIDQLAALCEERRLLLEQERIYFWLHAWLALHVPLSAALLVLGVAHAVMSLYY
jgi:hypothetical protein